MFISAKKRYEHSRLCITFSFSLLYKYNHGGSQIFQNARRNLKISRAREVTRTKFHAEGPQILGVSVQDLIVGQPGA